MQAGLAVRELQPARFVVAELCLFDDGPQFFLALPVTMVYHVRIGTLG